MTLLADVESRVLERMAPRVYRKFGTFAETEFIIPSGPREGTRFSFDLMPALRAPFVEFDRGRYTDFYGSGPVQGGKTTGFLVIPGMYHLCEVGEDVILGAPIADIAKDAWNERIKPAIAASRYKWILPTSGPGSRSGVPNVIYLKNGASIRFMGAGGGDQQISSYTARVVMVTEIDKMDEPGKGSREADPITKFKARSKAWGRAARFYAECTMSIRTGRIYREVVDNGTDSRVHLQCRRCEEWSAPTRESFVGWQDAETVIQAQARAGYKCQSCTAIWTEEDRQWAIRRPLVAAKGQTITKAGVVEGSEPETLTYGFRWNAMSSPLLTMADIARDEWEAERSGDEDREKGVIQYTWTEAYEGKIADLNRPEIETILAKIAGHPRGTVPTNTFKLTLGIDVGSFVIWWTLYSWTQDGQGHVVDFGGLDVPNQNGVKSQTAVLAALRAFRDNVVNPGWSGRRPDRILIDSGYEHEVVYQFVIESGQPRYLACKGYGTASKHGDWRSPPAAEPSTTRQVGTGWTAVVQPHGVTLIHVQADHWKAMIQDGFSSAQGAPGSLTLLNGEKRDPELRKFARQIVAEQREYKQVGEKEPKVIWVVKQRQNHYLDCSVYARCAGEIEGVRLSRPVRSARPTPQKQPTTGDRRGQGPIRYSY